MLLHAAGETISLIEECVEEKTGHRRKESVWQKGQHMKTKVEQKLKG